MVGKDGREARGSVIQEEDPCEDLAAAAFLTAKVAGAFPSGDVA